MDKPETQETPEQHDYTVQALGGFAFTVKDAKSKDYVEGYVRATLSKDVPNFQILELKITEVEE